MVLRKIFGNSPKKQESITVPELKICDPVRAFELAGNKPEVVKAVTDYFQLRFAIEHGHKALNDVQRLAINEGALIDALAASGLMLQGYDDNPEQVLWELCLEFETLRDLAA